MNNSSKTISTLQMWQHQMAALQRASRVRSDLAQEVKGAQAVEDTNKTVKATPQLIYPLLP